MGTTIICLLPMEFIKRLITLRKQRGLTQQALADADDLRLQLEAISQFDESEIMVARELLESLILQHNAKRAFANQIQGAK